MILILFVILLGFIHKKWYKHIQCAAYCTLLYDSNLPEVNFFLNEHFNIFKITICTLICLFCCHAQHYKLGTLRMVNKV